MALPLIGLVALILLSITIFVIGISRYNVNASLGLTVLAGVLLITSGMFIMNEGIQLETVDSITTSGTTTSISYQTIDYNINSWNWLRVITDIIFYGGFIAIIFGFAYNLKETSSRKNDEWAI